MSASALSGLDGDALARVNSVLGEIEAANSVRIIFAIESGSRAWGFPSPDSDYDCRFVFVRRRERYLSLWPARDVIEIPPEGDLDVNGWDVTKAIRLLCKGNAVILEWLASPILYRAEPTLRERFGTLGRRLSDRDQVGRHYLHLGEEQMRRHLHEGSTVPQKKIFYALRPAVASRWMRLHPESVLPPMHLPTLMAECDLPDHVSAFTSGLIARKAITRELGVAEVPAFIRDFILSEFDAARTAFTRKRHAASADDQAVADAFFGEVLEQFG